MADPDQPGSPGEHDGGAVLYRDTRWLVIDKPHGISTHAADPGDLGVAEWWALHRNETPLVTSRLDKATSGVLPFALTREADAQAQEIHRAGRARKIYAFVTDRALPERPAWVCDQPIEGRPAQTGFRVASVSGGFAVIEAEIVRGATHQIRRHAASSGVPVLGDELYGGTRHARLFLHCRCVEWPDVSRAWQSALPASFEAVSSRGCDDAAVALEAALDRRGRILEGVTDVYRLVHRGELAGVPASIDRFGDRVLVSGFDESSSAVQLRDRVEPHLNRIAARLGVSGATIRVHARNPHGSNLIADVASWGDAAPESWTVFEHGLAYEISFAGGRHPGLFADQRDSRRRLASEARGRRVANLFAFTASFSSAAIAAGAEVAMSIDLAAGCLQTAKRNFAASGLDGGGRGKFVVADVRDWLARQRRKRKRDGDAFRGWDWIVCDPPVFASSGKGATFSLQQEWAGLARDAASIMTPDGAALFSNNHRSGDAKRYCSELEDAFESVTPLRAPFDFPALPDAPAHVRIFLCRGPRTDLARD